MFYSWYFSNWFELISTYFIVMSLSPSFTPSFHFLFPFWRLVFFGSIFRIRNRTTRSGPNELLKLAIQLPSIVQNLVQAVWNFTSGGAVDITICITPLLWHYCYAELKQIFFKLFLLECFLSYNLYDTSCYWK